MAEMARYGARRIAGKALMSRAPTVRSGIIAPDSGSEEDPVARLGARLAHEPS